LAFFKYGSCGSFVDRVAYAAENIGETGALQGYNVCHGGCIQMWENAFMNDVQI
jgi:hypothetical protein